tara:strand:+ start:388 stop:501 length:114 start_codon:yes stop_codon:yes gene_type:complete
MEIQIKKIFQQKKVMMAMFHLQDQEPVMMNQKDLEKL